MRQCLLLLVGVLPWTVALLSLHASPLHPPPSALHSPFGICATGWSHSGANTDRFDFAGPARRLKLLARMGAKWDRCDFWWGRIEPQQGKFIFRDYDRAVAEYAKLGVELLPILCYGSAWHDRSPDTPEEWKLYARWAGKMVSHYRAKLHAWEVWNEPNISSFWKPEPNVEHYVNMLKAAYREMKKADPKCVVVAPATAGIDLDYIERFLELGGGRYCDVISVHPYQDARHGPEPGLGDSLRKLKELLTRYHLRKPIWITEMGWQTKPAKDAVATEDQQADYLVRSYVIALSEGVQRLFWFNLQDWAETWGTARSDFTLKPSYLAYQVMVKTLGEHPTCLGKLDVGNGVYRFVFAEPNGRTDTIVAWSTAQGQTFSLPAQQTVSTMDALGNTVKGEVKDDRAIFQLSGRPLYVLHVPRPSGGVWEYAPVAGWPPPRNPMPPPCCPL